MVLFRPYVYKTCIKIHETKLNKAMGSPFFSIFMPWSLIQLLLQCLSNPLNSPQEITMGVRDFPLPFPDHRSASWKGQRTHIPSGCLLENIPLKRDFKKSHQLTDSLPTLSEPLTLSHDHWVINSKHRTIPPPVRVPPASWVGPLLLWKDVCVSEPVGHLDHQRPGSEHSQHPFNPAYLFKRSNQAQFLTLFNQLGVFRGSRRSGSWLAVCHCIVS